MAKDKENLDTEETTPIPIEGGEPVDTNVPDENVSTTPNKDSFMNSIRGKYPEYENDEDVYAHANNSYKGLKEGKADSDKALESLSEAINTEPILAEFMRMVIKYPHDFSIALKTLPKDVLESALENYDNPVDDEAENNSLKEYRTKRQEGKEWENKFDENLNISKATLQSLAEKKGVEPSVISQALEETLMEVFDGNISETLMETILKGRDFDQKVEEVAAENHEQGLLEGKNAAIEEKKLKKETSTDGLVVPPSSSNMKKEVQGKGNPFSFLDK